MKAAPLTVIKAKKSLGQNFLTSGRIIEQIIESVSPLPSDAIVEIGPGTGALTLPLAKRAGYVVAIETDHRLAEELRDANTLPNLTVVEADALKLDWQTLIN